MANKKGTTEFPKGLFVKEDEKDFIAARLSFKTEEFIEWLKSKTNEAGYVNIDICTAKDSGKLYGSHWTPEEAPATATATEEEDDSLPF